MFKLPETNILFNYLRILLTAVLENCTWVPVSHSIHKELTGTISNFLFWCCRFSFELFYLCLSSRSLFSLMFPLCFLNWTQLCAFKGGWEPINSSSWLPCHQWPAHPFTHWPPGITAWKKVCVCLCGRVRMRLCRGFRCSEFWLACRFGFFHEAKQTSFHALLLNNWKKMYFCFCPSAVFDVLSFWRAAAPLILRSRCTLLSPMRPSPSILSEVNSTDRFLWYKENRWMAFFQRELWTERAGFFQKLVCHPHHNRAWRMPLVPPHWRWTEFIVW